ncbi:MAG: hypothetical protein FJ388_08275, partial [Verrucomicrobia bacterium]|nr:hypothetical protein [Verrucomicrobiota bacterium]
MNRKLDVIVALAVVLLASGGMAIEAAEPRGQVVILKDAAVGIDAATADAVAEALRREKFEVEFLSAEAVCDVAVLSPKKYFLYVIPNATAYPAAGADALARYLGGKGSLMVLGTPPFGNPVWKHGGRWVDVPAVREAMRSLKPDRMLFDFDTATPGKAAGWTRSGRGRKPTTAEVVAGGADGSAACLKITFDYESGSPDGWGATVKPNPDAAPGLLCFWVKGDGQTARLAVRLVEGDAPEQRGIAVVSINRNWTYHVLRPEDFRVVGRANPHKARRISFELIDRNVTPYVADGKHTVWVDQIGTAAHPFPGVGDAERNPLPLIETVSPSYKTYPLTNIASLKTARSGTIQLRSTNNSPHPDPLPSQARGEGTLQQARPSVSDARRGDRFGVPASAGLPGLSDTHAQPAKAGTPNQADAKKPSLSPRQRGEGRGEGLRLSGENDADHELKLPMPIAASSCYARPEGKGFERGYKWRWIPLVRACDKEGVERGTAAWMLLHQAPLSEGPAFADAVRRLVGANTASVPVGAEGSVCAACTISDPAALKEMARTGFFSAMARRISDGVFLSHAGSREFSYWPGERVQLGAVAVNHGAQQATVSVRIRVCAEAAKDTVFQEESKLAIKPGGSATASFVWAPKKFDSQSYVVTTELLRGGKVIDVIAHEMGVLSTEKALRDAFVRVRDGDFWVEGRKWYPVGVNYWPRYAIALEQEDYVFHWLSPGFYNPEEVERDLRQLESMGANFVAIRAHHQNDRRTVLDFLRRCRNHGIRVFVFVQSHVISDDPHYFQGLMMPHHFQEKDVAEFIRATRLAENPTLIGWDLIWEPAGWMFSDNVRSFG